MLTATYRLQFNADFTLDDARALVPYLRRLGVSHVYASPLLAARPGSTHGYDVVDPRVVNPELGGDAALRALAAALHESGMGLVLDIVPNHMGTGPANPFWEDVLTHGRRSRYAGWFDIDWGAPPARGRVLLPVLGDRLGAVLERDELRVVRRGARFRVAYYENSFPLDPATVHRVLSFSHRYEFPADDGEASADAVRRVRERLIPERGAAMPAAEAERALDDLAALAERSAPVRAYLDWLLAHFSEGEDGRYRLRALLDVQSYSLVYWRRAAQEVDYRRFFDVNDLVALRADAPGVFDETHARVLEWVGDGTVDALRIDHVDGLADPLAYLERLRAEVEGRRTGERVPVFVEKILSHGERLRREWPVDGTTGYEFANDLEALFIDPAGAAAVERGYQRLVGGHARRGFEDAARRGKAYVLRTSLAADVKRLTRALRSLPRGADEPALPTAGLARAVVELIVALPVYRTYVDHGAAPPGGAPGALRVRDEDRALLERALADAVRRRPGNESALRAVAAVLLGEVAGDARTHPHRRTFEADAFVARFQQTSGPATAKGVEDTALYRYVPLVSRNEVGGEADPPAGDAAARLHAANAERADAWPAHLLSVTTHDTKRSADVRARVDVLSEMPEAWLGQVAQWSRRHRAHKTKLRGRLAPDVNSEYLLYQTALGVWPLHDGDAPPADALASVAERVEAYMLKAAREAKVHTSWTHPRPDFEAALGAFVRALLREDAGARFRTELARLARQVAPAALRNGIARTLVHLTAPGTPDVYQGDELWNLALVDPDNRRPVDYAGRSRLLDAIERADADPAARAALARELAADPGRDGGALKLLVVRAALRARREHAAIFARGDYQALSAAGPRAGQLFAFGRTHEGAAAVTVVTRLTHAASSGGTEESWAGTNVAFPAALAGARVVDAIGGAALTVGADGALPVGEVFRLWPAALLLTAAS
jgi:(1->4)-alpha-D-glucan 1-alpha-D-glucosylmutase